MDCGKFVADLCLVFLVLVSILEARRISNASGDDRISLLHHEIPIEQFAKSGLCRHLHGQRYFQKAMKTKMEGVTEFLLENFVAQLCASKGVLLEMWVKELFDSDGNGKLNHFEIHLYKPDA